jgi:hypothetical protein
MEVCQTYHTTVGNEAAQMQTAIASCSALESLLDSFIVAKLILLDGLINTDNVLPDDATSANVQVTDFGVAHQTFGQTDSGGRSLKLSETFLVLGKGVHDRGLGIGDSITVLGRLLAGDTPSIDND